MNINEQELAEAVDRLWEGDNSAMLVKQEDVYNYMAEQDYIPSASEFRGFFEKAARYLLIEALRTHKEQEAGLM